MLNVRIICYFYEIVPRPFMEKILLSIVFQFDCHIPLYDLLVCMAETLSSNVNMLSVVGGS